MKILSAAQMQEADKKTMKREPISSTDLMERASRVAFEWIKSHVNRQNHAPDTIHIFCGIGNNGGDGLVLARLLANWDKKVVVYVVAFSEKRSSDFEINLERLKSIKQVEIKELSEQGDLEQIHFEKRDWIIDAIFGYGLSRPPEGIAAAIIQHINDFNAQNNSKKVISVDIPSGLFADDNSNFESQNTIKAAYTLTFQTPKKAFFFDAYQKFVGEFVVLNIGLDEEFLSELRVNDFWLNQVKAQEIYRPRKRTGHKGTFGHALLAVGAYGKIGAAQLCTKAALRSGAGLLSVRTPACGVIPLQTAIPEAMILPDKHQQILTSVSDEFLEKLNDFDSIGVGCGIGTDAETHKFLLSLLQNYKRPLVIDADALNILSKNRDGRNSKDDWLDFVPKNSILTPHPKEFERLFGQTSSAEERDDLLRKLAQKHQLCILLKGSFSAMAFPDGQVWYSREGDIGMATGGSGDVLTGILTSLLAQNYSPKEALLLGVYLHGKAGELAAQKLSSEAMLPSDLIDNLGEVFKTLNNKH